MAKALMNSKIKSWFQNNFPRNDVNYQRKMQNYNKETSKIILNHTRKK